MTGGVHPTRNVELPPLVRATLLLNKDSSHGVTVSLLPCTPTVQTFKSYHGKMDISSLFVKAKFNAQIGTLA